MAELPTLINLANLQNETTAVNAINSNSSAIGTAFLDVLSRSGTSPNQMATTFDMNSNRIVNLPAPIGATEPLRLTDANTLNGGGTIQSIPIAGTTGQVLTKNSSTNYDVSWLSAGLPVDGTTGQTLIKNSNTTYDVSWSSALAVRERLTADRTYFVATTGADSNNGLVIGTPFQHIQKAITTIESSIDLAGFNCTVQVADGTYAEALTVGLYVGRGHQGHTGPILIQGNSGNHSAVIIAPTSGNCVTGSETGGLEWIFKNVKFLPTSGSCVVSDASAWVVMDGVVFGAATGNLHVQAENGGIAEFVSNYDIVGGAAVHIYSVTGGKILYTGGQTVTITGTPAFSSFFAGADTLGLISASSITYSGSTTGARWNTANRGTLSIGGANPNTYFPGNSNGSASILTQLEGIATGQVIVSAGANTVPVWTATPTLTGLGLGTTSPQSKLHINFNTVQNIAAVGAGEQITGADGANPNLQMDGYGVNSYPQLLLRAAKGTAALPTAIQSGDFMFVLSGSGYNAATAAYGTTVGIFSQATENFTTGHQGTQLSFFTTPNATASFAEALRIQASGGISVGTTADLGTGGILANAAIKSQGATSGIGYAPGAGGTVTQATNRTTGVTLSKVTGQITTNNTSLAALAAATFTVTNTAVAATDTIVTSIASGATNVQTHVDVTAVAAGSFNITVDNQNATTAETGAIVINFAVIKGVTS